jgi:hypothetical protein
MHVLEQISEGMKVLDSKNHEIGKVEWIKLVEEDTTGQPIAADVDEPDRDKTLIDNLADAFRGDELPEVVQKRLLHDGFIRMDAKGLLAADRYVLPDQIARVTADSVVLNVTKDELVKKH